MILLFLAVTASISFSQNSGYFGLRNEDYIQPWSENPRYWQYNSRYDLIQKYQEAFVDKMLSYSLPYGHVLYCMNNETSSSKTLRLRPTVRRTRPSRAVV